MNKVNGDFYIKVNDSYKVVETIGRSIVTIPAPEYNPSRNHGIKWYQDSYKPEYRSRMA